MAGGGWWGSVGWGGGEGVGEWWVVGGGEGEAEGGWWVVGGMFAVGGGGDGEEEREGDCVCGGEGEWEWGWAMNGRIIARWRIVCAWRKARTVQEGDFSVVWWGFVVLARPDSVFSSSRTYLSKALMPLFEHGGRSDKSYFSLSTRSKHPPSLQIGSSYIFTKWDCSSGDIICYLTLPQHTREKDLGKGVHRGISETMN